MTTGAKLLATLVVALGIMAGAGWWWDVRQMQERERASVAERTALELRRLRAELSRSDSARNADAASWALQVHRAASDSLTSWLRQRAARPLSRLIDSIFVHDTTGIVEDSASQVCLSDDDARRLLARDSSAVDLADSLRGVVRLDSARIDSVRTLVHPPEIPWTRMGMAFGAGYVAGLGTCVLGR